MTPTQKTVFEHFWRASLLALYAIRVLGIDQGVEELWTIAGVPKDLMEQLAKAGFPTPKIDITEIAKHLESPRSVMAPGPEGVQ